MLKPLQDRVLILPDPAQETTSKGIILIQKPKVDEPKTGTVVVAGPGMPAKPITVKAGDKVYYQDYAIIMQHEEEGVKYDLIRETDILTRA